MTTIRVILALASANKWHLHQLDVNTAFLHGDLKEKVYMKIPQGLCVDNPHLVCKLEKSLYGLKQASRQWHSKLTGFLLQFGYQKSFADHSLFIKSTDLNFTSILVYVDDHVLAGNIIIEINRIKKLLDIEFSIKDLGQLNFFLGMEVARTNKGIFLYQRKYALDLLEDTGMLGSKPCSTAMEYAKRLISSIDGELLSDPTTYRRLMGKLLYLTHTRPDLSFTVGYCSQFIAKPTNLHFEGAKRILRYLKGSISAGIFFPAESDFKIKGYTDSDWAGCPDSRKSVSGYCFYLGHALISWKSKKQQVVARSSTEAEYRAIALASCEAQWLAYLLKDLQITHPEAIALFCDNQSAIHIAANPIFHERTKHIEVDCHSVREKIQSGLIHLLSIPTMSQIAKYIHQILVSWHLHEITFQARNVRHPRSSLWASVRVGKSRRRNKE
ncbi:PREDICTED: uncharacterized protein LOC109333914 [Lupinus angustifolius]|uniref:uncharacterized protein LOC109333914 n=1 Tax=Lupinus angustifolius TaxID=3871 RepID=UPI00092E3EBE|nr:PREDICTED: uncharacterized protein LOC109333914 [Lupinus angustifolius]